MNQKAFSFQKKIFVSSFLILLSLVLLSGVLTRILPMGRFERSVVDGRMVVDFESFRTVEVKRLPIYRWFSAPIEVLFGPDGLRISVLILLLLIVGGSFTILHESGALKRVIDLLVLRYASRKNSLLLLATFSFMVLGSALGLFEEVVPFVPIVVQLALQLGWDEFTGLGMSSLAAGFGFASATFNPFTVLLAQSLAGLPIFSGLWLRLIVFGVVYVILVLFFDVTREESRKGWTIGSDQLERLSRRFEGTLPSVSDFSHLDVFSHSAVFLHQANSRVFGDLDGLDLLLHGYLVWACGEIWALEDFQDLSGWSLDHSAFHDTRTLGRERETHRRTRNGFGHDTQRGGAVF